MVAVADTDVDARVTDTPVVVAFAGRGVPLVVGLVVVVARVLAAVVAVRVTVTVLVVVLPDVAAAVNRPEMEAAITCE